MVRHQYARSRIALLRVHQLGGILAIDIYAQPGRIDGNRVAADESLAEHLCQIQDYYKPVITGQTGLKVF